MAHATAQLAMLYDQKNRKVMPIATLRGQKLVAYLMAVTVAAEFSNSRDEKATSLRRTWRRTRRISSARSLPVLPLTRLAKERKLPMSR